MATLELPYGIEGLAALKQLTKADESVAEAGEALDFVVTEFHKEDRKIILSHTRTFSGAPVEEVKVEKKKVTKSTEKTATVTAEKSTMGDIGALSALKEQMEGAGSESPFFCAILTEAHRFVKYQEKNCLFRGILTT
jgi:small subunit ribosomal protein S1